MVAPRMLASECHKILGTRFLYREGRGPAWHGLGKSFPDGTVDAIQAVHEAGADFKIGEFVPYIKTKVRGEVSLPDYKVVARAPVTEDPEIRILGIVSSSYEVIQNAELARIVNPLTKTWPVETCGVLHKGGTLFLVLDGGEFEIKGDHGHQYFTLLDDKSGTRALRALFTPVVTVCNNTCVAAESSAKMAFRIRHHAGARTDLKFVAGAMASMAGVQKDTLVTFNALAQAKLVESQIDEILARVYPLPTIPKDKSALVESIDTGELAFMDLSKEDFDSLLDRGEKVRELVQAGVDRALAHRAGVGILYQRTNDERPGIAGSAYALYQAIVEVEDYKDGRGDKRARESALIGERARTKTRAYDLIVKESLN